MAVGSCVWLEAVREGLGDGFDFSVTEVASAVGRGDGWVVVRRFVSVVEGVTVRPGVVTVSDLAVVVVVVCDSPSIWRRT